MPAALSSPRPLSLDTVLTLRPFRESAYEILTPEADLTRPVRWAHALETVDPAAMLQGDELVLSTLTLFTEELPNLEERLREYLGGLASVGAACLAVEVLPERPRLLAALRRVTGEQRSQTPVVLLPRFVRFVEMTEHVHRTLIGRERGASEDIEASHDQQFDTASALLRRLHHDDSHTDAAVTAEARSLGLTPGASYLAFTCRFHDEGAEERDRNRRVLARIVRDAATTLHCPALVGGWQEADVAGIISGPGGQDLPHRVRRLMERTRALTASSHRWRIIPRFTVGMGRPCAELSAGAAELSTALEVVKSVTALHRNTDAWAPTSSSDDTSDCWSPQDVGLNAFLARITDEPIAQSFADWRLASIPETEYDSILELVRLLVERRCSKTELAEILNISRPTLYHRLSRLEHLLGGPADGLQLTTLYIALRLRSFSPAPR